MTHSPALNRRQLLRAAIGASAAPLLLPLWSAEAQSKHPKRKHAPGQTLVVVFHGLFAFLFGAKGENVSVAIPNVTGHVYWAGDFGREDSNVLTSGMDYKLSGVKSGGWNPVFDFPYIPSSVQDKSVIYATLTLPWPDELVLDRFVRKQATDYFSQPMGFKPKKFPMIYSFVYRDDTIATRPALDNTLWKAPRTWGHPGGTTKAVLHVRAEHCNASMTNGWDYFNRLFGFSGSNSIMLDQNYVNSQPLSANGIPGVVLPSEDDFLTEEPGFLYKSRPVNCASIGGKTGP